MCSLPENSSVLPLASYLLHTEGALNVFLVCKNSRLNRLYHGVAEDSIGVAGFVSVANYYHQSTNHTQLVFPKIQNGGCFQTASI